MTETSEARAVKTLVLEKKALKHNIAVVKERAGSAAIYGVLTGDGGGAGTAELARFLREEGVRRFAVSEPEEAEAVRKAGLVDEVVPQAILLHAAPPPTGRSWTACWT